MSINIRYRLIQFVEILLWLGAAAGLGQIGARLWDMRDQGWRAMLDVAVPGVLGIGAAMAALIVLIGIYHNTRRQDEALNRIARQGAGGIRRLPGAARAETVPATTVPSTVPSPAPAPAAYPAPAAPAVPAAPAAPPVPAAAPPTPVISRPAFTALQAAPVAPSAAVEDRVEARPEPAPSPEAASPTAQQTAPRAPAPVLRGGARRLGPAT